jgi:hypothetical protein
MSARQRNAFLGIAKVVVAGGLNRTAAPEGGTPTRRRH